MNDWELLERFTSGEREAFGELVRRHANWVYSVAKRRVRDANLAEDVAQAVFILLAQKARKMTSGTSLPAWLLRTTCFVANHAIRADQRRREHEKRAAMQRDQAQPQSVGEWEWLLDECVGRLGGKDRRAVLLRFYGEKTLAEVGLEMGVSEEAARKRISRAIEKLKRMMQAKGVLPAAGAAVILQCLEKQWVQAAPAQLTASASAAGLAGLSESGRAMSIAKGVNRMLMWNQAKIVAVAMLLLVMTPAVLWWGWARGPADEESSWGKPPAIAAKTKEGSDSDWMETSQVILALSPDHTVAWGFGVGKGEWVKMPGAGSSNQKIEASVTTDVAVFQQGNRIYGFSGTTGTWATADAPEGQVGNMMVSTGIGGAYFDGECFAFSPITASWDSFNFPSGQKIDYSIETAKAYARLGTQWWAFSPSRGKWSHIDTSQK
jgi:RNA polymerase sigma factor (sigma-70 family)